MKAKKILLRTAIALICMILLFAAAVFGYGAYHLKRCPYTDLGDTGKLMAVYTGEPYCVLDTVEGEVYNFKEGDTSRSRNVSQVIISKDWQGFHDGYLMDIGCTRSEYMSDVGWYEASNGLRFTVTRVWYGGRCPFYIFRIDGATMEEIEAKE